MKCEINTSGRRSTKDTRGMTLPEMMVTLAIGFVFLGIMVAVFMNASRSFSTMGNYVSMDQASRQALDQMTRDIRRAKNLVSFSTNQIVFNMGGTTNLVYSWNPASHQLTQWKTGNSRTNVLLSDCDSLCFSMFKNVPLLGGGFNATTVVSQGKSITVNWKCSRSVLGRTVTSEDMQQALIVIRNKPVL
jgi:prepilin-type N-terminal cleavage/methylation domain-containing protein